MSIFKRKASTPSPAPSEDPIVAFWTWWTKAGASLTSAAIDARDGQRQASLLSPAIDKIDPHLAWELGPGDISRHVLVVSAEGDPRGRATARRWLLQAPAPDDTWQYSDVRLPWRDFDSCELDIAGVHLTVGDCRFVCSDNGSSVDVVVAHPIFTSLDPAAASQIAFVVLDAALGELDVELWVGEIDTTDTIGPLAEDVTALRSAIRARRTQSIDDDAQPTWRLLSATTDGYPHLASAITPLRPFFAAELDRHLAVDATFDDRTDAGLPGPDALRHLRKLEEKLVDRLRPNGRLVAHETTNGRRTLHFFVDSTCPEPTLRDLLIGGGPLADVTLRSELDPTWSNVRQFRS